MSLGVLVSPSRLFIASKHALDLAIKGLSGYQILDKNDMANGKSMLLYFIMSKDEPCCVPQIVGGKFCGVDVIHQALFNEVSFTPNSRFLHKYIPFETFKAFVR